MRRFHYSLLIAALLTALPTAVNATPYASNVSISGTTVTYTLNEPTDSLTYSINGGAPVASTDGLAKGTHTFTIPAGTTFSIVADKNSATGFLIPTGGTIVAAVPATPPATGNVFPGLQVDSPAAGFNLLSDDTSSLNRFNSPRGVSVSLNPNSSNFGTVYVNNSASGNLAASTTANGPNTALFAARTLTSKGLYGLRADGTDAYGNADTAVDPVNVDGFPAFPATAAGSTFGTSVSNSGYRIRVDDQGKIWASDYSDVNGQLFQIDPNISIANGAGTNQTAVNIFAGFGGPATPVSSPPPPALPVPLTADQTALGPDPGCPTDKCTVTFQNHGSISSSWTTGSLAAGNLVVYTLDEDLNSKHFGGASFNDRNSVWQYNIGAGTSGGSTVTPTQTVPGGGTNGLIGDFPAGGIVADMTRGPDGKFYLMQDRSAGNEPGLLVFDPTGANVLYNSLTDSRALLSNATAPDILTNLGAIDVSPDGKWLASVLIDNDIVILPLVNGIPDLAHRLVVDGGSNTGNGRDISFDAADNLYYVSSGQGILRELSPGGHTTSTLTWNGSSYSFASTDTLPSAGVAGDYNGDGVVNAADYVVWRSAVAAGATSLTNRGSGISGAVGSADYTFWQAHFGATSGSGSSLGGAAVPEPGVLSLALLGLLAVGGCRKRSA